jgi:hypothetical protein
MDVALSILARLPQKWPKRIMISLMNISELRLIESESSILFEILVSITGWAHQGFVGLCANLVFQAAKLYIGFTYLFCLFQASTAGSGRLWRASEWVGSTWIAAY